MKKIALLIILIAGAAYLACSRDPLSKKSEYTNSTIPAKTSQNIAPLRVVFFQDCSPSIRQNGVEVVTSQVFTPYFENIHRKVELNVGFICDTTAHKLITLALQPMDLQKPLPVNLKDIPITRQRKVQTDYLCSVHKYEADSMAFFAARATQITMFRQRVDTILTAYRRKSSRTTDLIPVATIADKVFNGSVLDSAENYLIMNTDGIDSRHRVSSPMKNKAVAILVNASGMTHSSLDSIVTHTLQSTEQAIQYSLHNDKK